MQSTTFQCREAGDHFPAPFSLAAPAGVVIGTDLLLRGEDRACRCSFDSALKTLPRQPALEDQFIDIALPHAQNQPRQERNLSREIFIRKAWRPGIRGNAYAQRRRKIPESLRVLSDHGRRHQSNQRVPLLMRFPGGAIARRVRENTQLTDVAPTILDYLGLPQPPWMEGVSLLAPSRDPLRPIFGAGPSRRPERRPLKDSPYFRMVWASVALCDRSFTLNLRSGQVQASDIPGHTARCPRTGDGLDQAMQLLSARLTRDGYPMPSLATGDSQTAPTP